MSLLWDSEPRLGGDLPALREVPGRKYPPGAFAVSPVCRLFKVSKESPRGEQILWLLRSAVTRPPGASGPANTAAPPSSSSGPCSRWPRADPEYPADSHRGPASGDQSRRPCPQAGRPTSGEYRATRRAESQGPGSYPRSDPQEPACRPRCRHSQSRGQFFGGETRRVIGKDGQC